MAAASRVNFADRSTESPPTPAPKESIVTSVAKQALAPKTSHPRVINDIPSKLQQAYSLLQNTRYTEAAEVYREVISLLNDTADVQSLLYRSSIRQCLVYCFNLIDGSFDRDLVMSALSDLDQAFLKLENSSDDVEKITYYQKIRERYITFKTWPDIRAAFLEAKTLQCENKVDEIKMRTHLAILAAAPSEYNAVLPLSARQDEKEFTTLFKRVFLLTDQYHYAEAGVHVLKFRERLKDPLDPQKLIWRAHCNIQLSKCAFMGRYNLDSTIASDNRHLMICLASDAFEDLKKAQESLASRDIINSDTLRCDLYQRLHTAYTDLSRLQYWQTGAKVSELSQECLEKAKAAPSSPQKDPSEEECSKIEEVLEKPPLKELPKQEYAKKPLEKPPAAPNPPQKERSKQYSTIKIIFAIAMGFLGTILVVSLYHRVIVKK